MGVFLPGFELPRSKAESEMQRSRAFAEACVSALRTQKAALSQSEKSLAVASAQGKLGFPAAGRQVRILFGPCGGAACQDVPTASNFDASSEGDSDCEAWVEYC